MRPNDYFKVKWDMVIMVFSLFNCIFVPISVAFQPKELETQLFDILNYIIDSFFLIDIFIAFRTVYIDEQGQEETRYYYIARHYVKTTFIIDILATVPFDTILRFSKDYQKYVEELKKTQGNEWIQLLGVLKLGRILRLNKIIQFLKSTNDVKAGLKIFKMVLYLSAYLHCFACLWWLIVSKTQTWVSPLDQYQPSDYYRIYDLDIF